MNESSEDSAKGNAATHLQILERLFKEMGIAATIESSRREGRLVLYASCGEDDNIVIGRRGQTLEAIQYIVNRIVYHHDQEAEACIVDVSGYRERRRRNLEDLAKRSAERVLDTGIEVMVGPFNAFERHVIHSTLEKHPRVTTVSQGEGETKRIIFVFRSTAASLRD